MKNNPGRKERRKQRRDANLHKHTKRLRRRRRNIPELKGVPNSHTKRKLKTFLANQRMSALYANCKTPDEVKEVMENRDKLFRTFRRQPNVKPEKVEAKV